MDIKQARELAEKIRKNEEFYVYCSNKSKELYSKLYSEEIFIKKFEELNI